MGLRSLSYLEQEGRQRLVRMRRSGYIGGSCLKYIMVQIPERAAENHMQR